jgi:transposase
MDVVYGCCCGLDVHKKTVVACLIRPAPDGALSKEIRTFGTTTEELLDLRGWLGAAGCEAVAMESTGVYWKPIYNLLEGHVSQWVVNAAHIKAVPGRKTDVKDCEWIADLLRHGLLKASFIPGRAQRELRALTRTRTTLIDERTAAVNRLQKVLEDANIKLAGVASDVVGVSGRAMLVALLAGTTDPAVLADLAKGRLRQKRAQLERALAGRLADHHHLLIGLHLEQVDFLDEQIERLSEEIAERLRPFEADLGRLDTIPGIGRRTAEVLAAEMGLRMAQFPSAGHLSSWAGLAPGNHQSAGKSRGGTPPKGNRWIRRALVESALGAARTKGTYLAAQYHRLKSRRGHAKAIVALAHSLITIAYHLLARQTIYTDLGPTFLDERRRARAQQRALDQLRALGYQVTLSLKDTA